MDFNIQEKHKMKRALRVLKDTPFSEFRPVQEEAVALAIDSPAGDILEIPTGEGKSLIGVVTSLVKASEGKLPYLVTPTKSQVEQIGNAFPKQMKVAFGRSEYPCLYYKGETEIPVTAQDSPCYMLKCPHRVDQQTGETTEQGATPCPYYQAKYDAMIGRENGKITACTTSFFLTNQLFAKPSEDEDETGSSIIFDEGHNLAKIARGIYEFTLTDYHLKRAQEILRSFDHTQANIVKEFRSLFMRIARDKKAPKKYNLLETSEISKLIDLLDKFDANRVERVVREAIESSEIDPLDNREEIKLLENLVRNIPAFVRSMKYSLSEETSDGVRQALNYVVAFCYKKDDPEMQSKYRKAQYHLTIKAYYVAPLIKRAIGDNANVTVMSATIGNPEIFSHETGLKMPFTSFPSSFDPAKTRIFLPRNTPNLSQKVARRNDPKLARRMVMEAVSEFSQKGIRSLIVTVSNAERESYFLDGHEKYGLEPLTYGDGLPAREVATEFREGYGDCLIGTASQFGEGIDLPAGTCPVIFFVRPSYPRPDDPMTLFEKRRFSNSRCWNLWQYRVMIQALQVRGRNIRTKDDLGVCFFVSQQFKKFLYGSLPEWLQPSYVGDKSVDECVKETMELLKSS